MGGGKKKENTRREGGGVGKKKTKNKTRNQKAKMSSSSGFCEPLLNYNQMENSSAYHGHGPSPIPTHQSHPAAALVAFSQASSLSEALRLSRPFPQVKQQPVAKFFCPLFLSLSFLIFQFHRKRSLHVLLLKSFPFLSCL